MSGNFSHWFGKSKLNEENILLKIEIDKVKFVFWISLYPVANVISFVHIDLDKWERRMVYELGDWDWHVYTDVYKIDDWLKKKEWYILSF